MPTTLEEDLRKAIQTGDALFIVGPGISAHATGRNPWASRRGLVEEGIAECEKVAGLSPDRAGLYRGLASSGEPKDLLKAAELVSEELEAPGGDYGAWLRRTVGSLRAGERSILEALRDLPGVLATINPDGLLEEVTGLDAVTWRQGNKVERVLRGEESGVLHLHGYWDEPESVRLGIRDYQKLLGDGHAQAMLRATLSMKTLVFVGCDEGLADPNFSALLEWARGVFRGSERVHYRLALAQEAEALCQQHRDDRIKVVPYGSASSELARFLRSLAPVHVSPGAGRAGAPAGFDLSRVVRPFRDPSALRELAGLLSGAGLPRELLDRQFWSSVPPSWHGELAGGSADAAGWYSELVDVLSRLPARPSEGRTFPLLEFVLRVSLDPDAAGVRGALRAWLDRNAPRVGVNPVDLKVHEQKLIGALYLLVKLERVPGAAFSLQAWLGDDTGAPLRMLLDGDRRCRLEEVPAALGELWSRGELRERLRVVDQARLTVEFLLPRELLFHPVEAWECPPGPAAVRLGGKCRVVVRSIERVYAEVRASLDDGLVEAPLAWRGKWLALQRGEAAPLWITGAADLRRESLLAKLLPEEVGCLALALTPPGCPDETLREVVHLSIARGMPAALWSRQQGAGPDAVRASFEPLCAELRELPDRVRRARWSALEAADPGHPGHHLTLLWDDPDRVPPDARPDMDYGAPPMTGANG